MSSSKPRVSLKTVEFEKGTCKEEGRMVGRREIGGDRMHYICEYNQRTNLTNKKENTFKNNNKN